MSGSSKVMLRVMVPLPWVHALLLGGGHRCGGQEVVVQPSPAEGIERHRAGPRLPDEDALLAAVRAIPALADSGFPSGSSKRPGTMRTVCSPRPMSSGSGLGHGRGAGLRAGRKGNV
jgi:hypothetical protein